MNIDENNKYDLICSLGGDCSAANNLRYRHLRVCSYPFEWTYFNSDDAVYVLADEFKNKFENYMKRENLKELPINPSHPDNIQYEDTYGKLVWANHFSYKENRDANYKKVKEKFDKRKERLLFHIQKSEKILFLFSVHFYVKMDSFIYLSNVLNDLYPNKKFYIKIVSFDSPQNETVQKENIEIFYVQRKNNEYDFLKTNYEWHFLDEVKLKKSRINNFSFKLFGYTINVERRK